MLCHSTSAAGLFARERDDGILPRVEYELTDAGEELCDRLDPLLRWAESVDIDV